MEVALLLLVLLMIVVPVTVAIVAALVLYKPPRPSAPPPPPKDLPPKPSLYDLCEVCGELATCELGAPSKTRGRGEVPVGRGDGMGMVATYCGEHAPAGAVRVR